jgi:hypothetical protein
VVNEHRDLPLRSGCDQDGVDRGRTPMQLGRCQVRTARETPRAHATERFGAEPSPRIHAQPPTRVRKDGQWVRSCCCALCRGEPCSLCPRSGPRQHVKTHMGADPGKGGAVSERGPPVNAGGQARPPSQPGVHRTLGLAPRSAPDPTRVVAQRAKPIRLLGRGLRAPAVARRGNRTLLPGWRELNHHSTRPTSSQGVGAQPSPTHLAVAQSRPAREFLSPSSAWIISARRQDKRGPPSR